MRPDDVQVIYVTRKSVVAGPVRNRKFCTETAGQCDKFLRDSFDECYAWNRRDLWRSTKSFAQERSHAAIHGRQPERPNRHLHFYFWWKRAIIGSLRFIGQMVDRVAACITRLTVGGIFGIKVKSSVHERRNDSFTQCAQLSTRARLIRYDLQINVFGHARDESVCAAQRRSATEYETERCCINRIDRGESPNDMPILLDEYRAWEIKMLLNLEELLE